MSAFRPLSRYRWKLANGTYVCRRSSTPAGDAMATLSSFLSGLKVKTSPTFSLRMARSFDISGKMWFGREEIRTAFERLLAPYAKKNTTYRVERTFSERPEAVLASVLWENEVHTDQTSRSVLRMTILLVPEGEEWSIFLVQVVPVTPKRRPVSIKFTRQSSRSWPILPPPAGLIA